MSRPDLDHWLEKPSLTVRHSREADADPDLLWEAACAVRLADTRLLGRLVRWRIPGIAAGTSFDELFRNPPFTVLEDGERALVAGLVGKIWTLNRDYPLLDEPEQFRAWSVRGTARVLFANWVEPADGDRSTLHSESRVRAVGAEGRLGLTAVRPFVAASQNLVLSDGIEAAVRRARSRR